jgi:hypothetical protein
MHHFSREAGREYLFASDHRIGETRLDDPSRLEFASKFHEQTDSVLSHATDSDTVAVDEVNRLQRTLHFAS